MTIWEREIKDLDKVYESFKDHIPDIVKELDQLLKTDDANVVLLYSRRCLEVIITDLCESGLKRPRKTEPLKGIIDKLNIEELVPSHIITSMLSLNSMAAYGAHPKDFDPEQVKSVLINLAIIIRWYLKYKDFKIISKPSLDEKKVESNIRKETSTYTNKSKKRLGLILAITILGFTILTLIVYNFKIIGNRNVVKDVEGFVKDRDGNTYKTVKIGTQVWMKENLKVTKYNDGTEIPKVTDNATWRALTTGAYSDYNNNPANSTTYGRLYNWYTVDNNITSKVVSNRGKNVCPTGWHVPTNSEWNILAAFLGGTDIAGGKLKETGSAHWKYPNMGATNETGFTALPGGYRYYSGFNDIGSCGRWWSSTEQTWPSGSYRAMTYNYVSVYSTDLSKYYGFSVRCVRD